MIFKFKRFTLDTTRFALCLEGEPVAIEPLAFNLLAYLITHRNRVVSKEELFDALWCGKVVTDAALGARLKDARKAVQDSGSKQDTIKTLHRRGYQFVADVTAHARPSSLETPGDLPSIPTSPDSQDKPSIAVLPFKNLSNDPEQDYFSDGMTEDIITELSRFRTIFVAARKTSFLIKGKKLSAKEVGSILGVHYLVEGSIRRAGNRIRISAQLVQCESGNHIWAERYDKELDDIFDLQDEVTRSIVAVLPGRVEDDVIDRAQRKPTENRNAYELVMQAKAYRDLFCTEANIKLRECCEKALALDPYYARAYMYISDSCVVDIWWGVADEDGYRLALEYARKAIALDPNDMFIQDHLGFAFLSQGMWEEAEAQFDKTLPKITNEAESMAWIGYAYLLLDHREKAREVVLEAMRRNPLHRPTLDWALGQIYYFEERYDEVVKLLVGEALLSGLAHGFLAGAYANLNRADEAKASLNSFIQQRHREFGSRNRTVKENSIEALAGSFRAMWRNPESWNRFAEGLRKAGLPE